MQDAMRMNRILAEKEPQAVYSIEEAIARVVRDELGKLNLRQKRLLTIEEAAEYLNVSKGTIHNLMAEKKLAQVYFMRWPMIDIEDLDRLIRESKRVG